MVTGLTRVFFVWNGTVILDIPRPLFHLIRQLHNSHEVLRFPGGAAPAAR